MRVAITTLSTSTLTLGAVKLSHYRSLYSLLVMSGTFLGHLNGSKFWTEIELLDRMNLQVDRWVDYSCPQILETAGGWSSLPSEILYLRCHVYRGVRTSTSSAGSTDLHQDVNEQSKSAGMTTHCPRRCSSTSNLVIVAIGSEHSLCLTSRRRVSLLVDNQRLSGYMHCNKGSSPGYQRY